MSGLAISQQGSGLRRLLGVHAGTTAAPSRGEEGEEDEEEEGVMVGAEDHGVTAMGGLLSAGRIPMSGAKFVYLSQRRLGGEHVGD